jgi:hypothetical protein
MLAGERHEYYLSIYRSQFKPDHKVKIDNTAFQKNIIDVSKILQKCRRICMHLAPTTVKYGTS